MQFSLYGGFSMGIYIGCDIGTVSVKAAVAADAADTFPVVSGGVLSKVPVDPSVIKEIDIYTSSYRRIQGNPLDIALGLLHEIVAELPANAIRGLCLTGSGARLVADYLGARLENEFKTAARGVGSLYPDVKYVFEMGGENSKFLNIRVDDKNGDVGIVDYETNGDCAAGTGSFMDQQASRLRYNIEDVGEIVISSRKSAKIAGRCSVFAKSDMIHAQQKGATPPEVLKGLCEAVARNFKGNIAKGRSPSGRTAFIGGVAHNMGVVQALENVFQMNNDSIYVPDRPAFYGAIGAALILKSSNTASSLEFIELLREARKDQAVFPSWEPLDLSNVRLLRNEAHSYEFPPGVGALDVYIGVDIGSVSTNLVCIDGSSNVIHEIYLRTEARPVEIVGRALKEIESRIGGRINVKGVGTTGSGRELIGELIGADTINDEITAHKTGAFEIARRYLGSTVDTIFEIGG